MILLFYYHIITLLYFYIEPAEPEAPPAPFFQVSGKEGEGKRRKA